MRVALEKVFYLFIFFLLVFFIDCFLPGPLKTKCIFRWRGEIMVYVVCKVLSCFITFPVEE